MGIRSHSSITENANLYRFSNVQLKNIRNSNPKRGVFAVMPWKKHFWFLKEPFSDLFLK